MTSLRSVSFHPLLLLAPLVLLAGCGRSEPEPTDRRPQPILPGSISDAMLNTDQLRAEAPLAPPEATGAAGADEDEDEAGNGDGAARPARRRASDSATPPAGRAPDNRDGEDAAADPSGGASPAPAPAPKQAAPKQPTPSPAP